MRLRNRFHASIQRIYQRALLFWGRNVKRRLRKKVSSTLVRQSFLGWPTWRKRPAKVVRISSYPDVLRIHSLAQSRSIVVGRKAKKKEVRPKHPLILCTSKRSNNARSQKRMKATEHKLRQESTVQSSLTGLNQSAKKRRKRRLNEEKRTHTYEQVMNGKKQREREAN